MSGRVIVRNSKSLYITPLDVYINGKKVGHVKNNGVEEFPISGDCELSVRCGINSQKPKVNIRGGFVTEVQFKITPVIGTFSLEIVRQDAIEKTEEKRNNLGYTMERGSCVKVEKRALEVLKSIKLENLANTKGFVEDMETLLSTMSSKEEIEHAFFSTFIYHNRMQESITDAVCWITNKKLYYIGSDGKSSVFVSGANSRIMANIDLKDVHSIGSGKTLLLGTFITFETKNEDFKFQSVGLDTKTIISILNQAIEVAKADASKEGATFIQALSAADELKKFKELLDMGVISQEEFDAKKKQLLGL